MAGKAWTEEEEIYLELYYNDVDNFDLNAAAEFLGRSKKSIVCKAVRLRKELDIRHFEKVWTKEEDDYIIENYLRYTYAQLGRRFGVTEKAITDRIRTLKLPKKNKYLTKYDSEIRKLAKEGKFRSEIAEILGLELRQINSYVIHHKIKTKLDKFKPKKSAYQKYLNDVFWQSMKKERE
ncbi:hypothetical protein [Lactococcus protaetiae]|uniref:Uncharacterized protein n=1 Tax=Lactococcus protaetiae TaxID=2592653 RepID=A0A514ZAA3_9LACT|nr:hypothetical protein [Lactococcus protaetiae]QDK71477.1 hypothetical protein FLP15_10275 [Lactococcus protaetiae]